MKPSDPGLAQNLSISHNCPDYVQCLCLGQGQAIKSGFCPELVLVQYLSSQCPRSVSGRWEPNQSGIKYRFCPESVQSKICPENVQHQRLPIPPLDILWTRAGFSCPIFVQRPLTWTGSLHQLDSDWTDPVLFLPLDRSWTECRQTLDKSWILCPGSVHPLSNHPLLTRTTICSLDMS